MDPPILNGIGFKATHNDLTCCTGFKYKIGQVYEHSGPLEICKSGFHLCEDLHHTFAFYSPKLNVGNRYFVVSYDDRHGKNIIGLHPKVVTKAIRLDAEIKVEDPLEINNMVKRYPTEHMLLYMARHGSSPYTKEVFKQLLKAGADVHVDDDAVLRWASKNGHTEIVRLLLEHGADVHAKNDYALRNASEIGHTEVVRLLLDKGANVHIWADEALRVASYEKHTEVVKLLLEAGADMRARDYEALRWAGYAGHTEVVQLLLEHGADVHALDNQTLRLANRKRRTEVIKLLLDYGADKNALAMDVL